MTLYGFFASRAQIDELQKKQDKLNAFKNRKSNSTVGNSLTREVEGESPNRKPLSMVKSSRSSSTNRVSIKRLTAVSPSHSSRLVVDRFVSNFPD